MAIKIEITSIDDLMAFVDIIRCKGMGIDYQKLVDDLNASSDKLKTAIDESPVNQRVQKEK